MKTYVLQLDSHDDVFTILDKLGWCKSGRILLVFPKKVRRPLNQVDLNLVLRFAQKQGAQLAIVTRQSSMREAGIALQIAVYPTLKAAQGGVWEIASKRPPIEEFPQKGSISIQELGDRIPKAIDGRVLPLAARLMLFIFAILALLSMLVFILPTATVRVYPLVTKQKLILDIVASAEVDTPGLGGLIPAYTVTLTKSGEKSRRSTGSVLLPQTKATGQVTLTNPGANQVNLPGGTVLTSTGQFPVRFETISSVTIEPGEEIADLKVQAVQPGENGNLDSDEQLTIEGVLASSILVSSHSQFSGGSSSQSAAPSLEDYEELKAELLTMLQEEVTREVQETIESNVELIPGSVELDQIVSEEMVYLPDEASDQAELKVEAIYRYRYYQPDAIDWIANYILNSKLGQNEHVVDPALMVTSQTDPQFEGETALWSLQIERQIVTGLEVEEIKREIAGKRIAAAIKFLNSKIPHTQSAQVVPAVKFWGWLPFMTEQIKIEEVISNDG